MTSTPDRRGNLVHLAHLLAFWQARRGPRYQFLEGQIKAAYAGEGHTWDGGRDITWIKDELLEAQDTAEPYPPASYYRFRINLGLPIWAAVAAGMHLTRDQAVYREELDERRRQRDEWNRHHQAISNKAGNTNQALP